MWHHRIAGITAWATGVSLFATLLALGACGGGGDQGANGGGGATPTPAGQEGQQPSAPADARVYLKTYNTVEIRWKDTSTNEDGFRVFQVGKDEPVATAARNVGRAVIERLQCGTDYQFEVRAHNADGESYSNPLDVTTKLCAISVTFGPVCVSNDEDPVGAGELWFWFRSGGSTGKRFPASGTKSVESHEFGFNTDIFSDPLGVGFTYAENPECFDPTVGFQFSLRFDEPIEIFAEGWDEDDIDPDDSLGTVSVVYESGTAWDLKPVEWRGLEGRRVALESSSNGDFDVIWEIDVTGLLR